MQSNVEAGGGSQSVEKNVKFHLIFFFSYVCHLTLEIFEVVVILSYKEPFVQTSQLVK